jgi:hypothetical protein
MTPTLRRYAFRDVAEAPKGPGVYAWYAKAPIGPRDWQQCIFEGRDQGVDNFMRVLAAHTRRFANINLRVSAESSFDTAWEGTLKDTAMDALADVLGGMTTTDEDESTFRSVVHDAELRQVFASVLANTAPAVASPIYIGKAKLLADRLQDHTSRISLLLKRCRLNRAYLDRLPEKDEFADRAVKMGFNDESLEVYTWDFTQYEATGFSKEKLNALAVSLEFLLNRWHRPLLGRK